MTNKMLPTRTLITILIILGIAVIALAMNKTTLPEIRQPQVSILPLYDHLIETPPKWKEAYGDTLEVRFVYNLTVLRSNQMEIAKMISKLHPPIDVNEPIDPNMVRV